MQNAQRIIEVAEAVADGRVPDWPSVERSAADPADRGVIANLRTVQDIHSLYTTCTGARDDEGGCTRLAPGDVWGGLEIREQIGRGRFGDVYRAWDPALDRDVALKIVRHGGGGDGAESRIVEEGRLMARVRHPNVVAIHGAQRLDGVTGLWMEYVPGRTLASEIGERGAFTLDEVVHVGIELGSALAAVHRAGLVHRDVKAQNVLRDVTGRIVLGDFGTGREIDGSDGSRGGLVGTPVYLAPELFERHLATPQSDLYALGVLLFQLTTGRFPVPGRSLREIRDAHTRGDRVRLTSLRSDLPASFTAVVDRALDPDPQHRFGNADEMVRALEDAMTATAMHQPGSRRGVVFLAVFALCVTALVGVRWAMTGAAGPSEVSFAARDFVLVAALDNRTDTPVLDGTLEYVLARELAGSTFVNVVPPGRVDDVLRMMRKPQGTRIDVAIAREIALRDGAIRAVVAPRVQQVKGVYSVTVDALTPADGAIVASVADHAVALTDVVPAMHRLSIALRRRLGESLTATGAVRDELSKVTTPSLRALNLYSQLAMESDEWPGVDAVLVEQRVRAVLREDPEFASAHMRLAVALRNQRRWPEALQAIERAVELSGQVTEVERLVIMGELYVIRAGMATTQDERTQRFERAAAAYEAVLTLEPDHDQALVCLTNIYGTSLGRPKATVATRLAMLRPRNAAWQVAAAVAILFERPENREAARPYVLRARQLGFGDAANARHVAWARAFDAYDAWLRNDLQEAVRLADALASDARSLPGHATPPVLETLSYLYLTLGRLEAASQVALLSPPRVRQLQSVRIAVAREDPSAIRELVAREFPSVKEFFAVVPPLIVAGELDKARLAMAFMRRQPPGFLRYFHLSEGLLALAEGRARIAVTHLEQLSDPRDPRESLTLAQALTAEGRLNDAIVLLEDVSRRRAQAVAGQFNPAWDWLRAREVLAQLYRRAGRHAEADDVDTELRMLLEVADDDHPMKQRLARLVRPQRGR